MLGGLLGLGALGPVLQRVAQAADDTRLVVFWNDGGWDSTFVFDPHFGSAVIEGDPFAVPAQAGGIDFADAASRPSVRRVFEDFGDRSIVLNGLAVGSISHTACARLMLTGSRERQQADLPSLVAASLSGSAAVPFLALSGPRFPGERGQVLLSASPDAVGLISATREGHNEALIQDYLAGLEQDPSGREAAYFDALGRLPQVLEQGDLLTGASDLERAISALEADLCRSLLFEATLPMRTMLDSHQDNQGNQAGALEQSFSELHTLLSALYAAGTLDRTLVLVLSEMGRTPVLNAAQGKDHWPYTSALLVGGGISGGRVIGASDDSLVAVGLDRDSGAAAPSLAPPTAADLLGGVLQHLDLDAQALLPGCAPIRL